MAYLIISLFLYTGVLIFDIMPLIKKNSGRFMLIYLPVFLLTLTINVLYGLGVNIPSPADPIKDIVSSIFGLK